MQSRKLAQAAWRSADEQSDRFAEAARSPMRIATVSTVIPNGAASRVDPLISVTYDGSETTAAGYADGLSVAVGNRVLCVLEGQQLFILCRIVGQS